MRVPGWGNTDVLALLSLFRKHLLHYVYASDAEFAQVVRAELPGKTAVEIQEMVRSLMLQFGLVLSTKNFRTEVIATNGHEVYVYEHIYESISQLLENRSGGVWLPDELSRFLQKAKQYRELFSRSQEVYFKRVQLWGKSVAESKSKFYTLRELYIREKRRSRQRTRVEIARLELLKEIFSEVPPARREEKLVAPSKAPKLWSSEEMETLVDFLVRITSEIQRNGSSDLVNEVAESLHRTDGSCMNKLADMREKFLKKSTSVRAANLPGIVFDPTSEAYKIFNADWNDNNDPYALGYFAIKSRCLRILSVRNKKRKGKSIWAPRPKLRSTTIAARKVTVDMPAQSGASIAAANPASRATHPNNLRSERAVGISPQSASKRAPSSTLAATDYAAFVRDVAEQCQWTEEVVHNVLRCMQHSIELYRTNNLVAFFTKIASLTPGVTFQDLFADAQYILTQFEKRFDTLDGFENLVLIHVAPDIIPSMALRSEQETKQDESAVSNDDSTGSTPTVNLGTPVGVTDEQESKQHDHAIDYEAGASSTADDAHINALSENANKHANSENGAIEDDRGSHGQSSPLGSPAQTPQTGNEDAVMDGDDSDHEQSPLLGSPVQTPQTGNEDAADEHSSSTGGKQSSPEDVWGDGVDADADLDDDGLDSHSVGSSDNAWSGSSNISDAKGGHYSKDNNNPYPLVRQFTSDSSKKPSKRGKDEQYGKRFDLAKKRRLDEENSQANDEEEDEVGEDEGYDEGEDDDDDDDDDDDLNEDVEVPDDIDNTSSDGEQDEPPHPLQDILDSYNSQIVELREKQSQLIKRKEGREWRELQCTDREFGIYPSMQSLSFER
ncbi:hypothetical protein PRIC2_008910 [Phytophthora ramorum]